MLKRGLRLSSALRSAVSRQLAGPAAASQAPCLFAAEACVPRQSIFEPKLLASHRCFSTAISKDLALEIEHATGLEKEELVGEAEGKPRFDLSPPQGPFGTTEAPAVVESFFDERLVGCSGGIGEEEHDVVWFKLKKETGHECSVCGQFFQLKVIGEGGPPGGHH